MKLLDETGGQRRSVDEGNDLERGQSVDIGQTDTKGNGSTNEEETRKLLEQ